MAKGRGVQSSLHPPSRVPLSNGSNGSFLFAYAAAALYLVVYGFQLGFPPTLYFDEIYQAKTGQQLAGLLPGYTETSHPPFAMLLMALSIRLFGDHSFAWRLPSLLMGLGSLLLVYSIARTLSDDEKTGRLAAFLFGVDGIAFTQARIGMLNATMLFWVLLSVYFTIQCTHRERWEPRRSAALAGAALGLAVASRWAAVTIAVVLLALILRARPERRKTMLNALVYPALPAALAAYFVPFLVVRAVEGYDWSWIIKTQYGMLQYHVTLKETHPYGSSWWSWPLLLRPIWYHFEQEAATGNTRGILCVGNPVFFWTLFPVMVWSAVQFWRSRSALHALTTVGFLTQWLQWAPVTRVTFFHYFYTVMPFAAIAASAAVVRLWEHGGLRRALALAYLAAVALLFVYWYPLLSGMTIPNAFYRHHLWFRSWI